MNTSKDQLMHLLDEYQGDIIELCTDTPVKMSKGGRKDIPLNPYYEKDVRKVKTTRYEFGKSYTDKINEALAAEGRPAVPENHFTDKLPWGNYEIKNKVVRYKDTRYLRCYLIKDEDVDEQILVDGEPATEEQLKEMEPYLPPKKESRKQSDAGISAEHSVSPLLFSFDNIRYIVLDGTRYDLV